MQANSHIKCSVNQCRHNNQAQFCTLGDIVVGCSTSSPHDKCDTECDSFEENVG